MNMKKKKEDVWRIVNSILHDGRRSFSPNDLTDDNFPPEALFQVLEMMPEFIQAPFTLGKIRIWRYDLNYGDEIKSNKARTNLVKIGSTLAMKNKISQKAKVVWTRAHIYTVIKQNNICRLRNKANRRLRLVELFKKDKYLIPIANDIPNTNMELADVITANHFNLKPQTVRQYCKDTDLRPWIRFWKKAWTQ